MLNRSSPMINCCGTPEIRPSHRVWGLPFFVICLFSHRFYPVLFFVFHFIGTTALSLRRKVAGSKHLVLRLTNHDIYHWISPIFDKAVSRAPKTLRFSMAYFERDNVRNWSLFENNIDILKKFFSKYIEICLFKIF